MEIELQFPKSKVKVSVAFGTMQVSGRRTTYCIGTFHTRYGNYDGFGKAVCSPKDTYDPKVGTRVAFKRMIEYFLDHYVNNVDPAHRKDIIDQARRQRYEAEERAKSEQIIKETKRALDGPASLAAVRAMTKVSSEKAATEHTGVDSEYQVTVATKPTSPTRGGQAKNVEEK